MTICNNIHIKVCGLNNIPSLKDMMKLPIEYIGLNFYSESPRYIIDIISPAEIIELESNIKLIGVFVNEEITEILNIVHEYHLDGVQLHGNESPTVCNKFKESNVLVIKAFSIHDHFDFDILKPYDTVVDYYLFDTKHEKLVGGTGKKFDWNILNRYDGSIPYLLSGGISPNDVQDIKSINHSSFIGVDINSGFEIEPGVKDKNLVSEFVSALKEAQINS